MDVGGPSPSAIGTAMYRDGAEVDGVGRPLAAAEDVTTAGEAADIFFLAATQQGSKLSSIPQACELVWQLAVL